MNVPTREVVRQLYSQAFEALNRHRDEGTGITSFRLLRDYADAHALAIIMGVSSEDLNPEKMAEIRGEVRAWEEIRIVLSGLLTPPKVAADGTIPPAFPSMFTPGSSGRPEGM